MDEPVNDCALSNCADDDCVCFEALLIVADDGLAVRDTHDVGLQIVNGANDTGKIVRIHRNSGDRFALYDWKTVSTIKALDILRLA